MNRFHRPNSQIGLETDAELLRTFFGTTLAEIVYHQKFANERSLYGIERDMGYVAALLWHSALFGFEHRFGVWGSMVRATDGDSSEIEAIERQVANGLNGRAAQDAADHLLLLLSIYDGKRRLQPSDSRRLKHCGEKLYLCASRQYGPPIQDNLRSMASNFLPWTDVLYELNCRYGLVRR